MAISIDWPTGVIYVPQADLTPLGGGRYELDVDAFRLELRALEASEAGMAWPPTHTRYDPYTIGSTTYAQGVGFINGYTVEFENGMYEVRLVGANTNLADVKVVNSVSVVPSNSAGLIVVSSGSGLSTEEHDALIQTTTRVDAAITTRATPADVPSAATVRDAILSDSTPFAGAAIANLDAAVSTRAAPADVPTAVQNRDAILSDATRIAGADVATMAATVASNLDAPVSTAGGLTVTQATQLLELYRLMALDPEVALTVAETYRRAGAGIQQTISEVAGVVTVTRTA